MTWYRVGRKLGRSIYRCTEQNPDGLFVGIMDDPDFAQEICDALNAWVSLPPIEPAQEEV